MSDNTILDALKAYVTAETPVEALDLDEVKARASAGTLPANYVETYLSPRFGGNVRGGMRSTDLRRFSTRVVASTVSNVLVIEEAIRDAFAFAMVDLGSGVRAHLSYESGGGSPEYDEGKYVGILADWTFTV